MLPRSANPKTAYNASVAARLRWVAEDLTTAQMLRFLSHEPRAIAAGGRGAAESAAAFYHAILLADAVDESLVAFALAVPGVALEDVLYVSAKTTHTARRPATERLSDGFRPCANQPVSWDVPTKLQTSRARSNRSRFG